MSQIQRLTCNTALPEDSFVRGHIMQVLMSAKTGNEKNGKMKHTPIHVGFIVMNAEIQNEEIFERCQKLEYTES